MAFNPSYALRRESSLSDFSCHPLAAIVEVALALDAAPYPLPSLEQLVLDGLDGAIHDISDLSVRHASAVEPQNGIESLVVQELQVSLVLDRLGDELGEIRQPTLVIWGERDWQGAAIGKESTERLRDGRFMVVPDIGHFPFLEAPQVCAKAILNFLQS